jgi:hypothetical protein
MGVSAKMRIHGARRLSGLSLGTSAGRGFFSAACRCRLAAACWLFSAGGRAILCAVELAIELAA